VIRTLPLRFDPKVYVVEEMKDLVKLTMDELHGILIAYKMRKGKVKPTQKEKCSKHQRKPKNTNVVISLAI